MTVKKRYVRLIILLFICPMLLMASCRGDAVFKEGEADNDSSGFPDVLKITRCLYFGDTSDYPDMKEEFIRVFYEKTGIMLEITYPPRNNYMEKVNLMIASGELDGMVNFFSPSNVLRAAGEHTIEPLDEYLKDNENWNSAPEDYRNTYRIDGRIYAVPAGYDGTIFTRSFRKDWLDRLGLDIPETTDDLFEVARAFTEGDPDGNGVDDTYGLTSSKFWNLQDIFQAFDVMLCNTGEISIAWDPVSGVWQDSMLKPEMEYALGYIKKLYDSGYLDPDFLTNQGSNMKESLLTGKAGSAFYWITHGVRYNATQMKDKVPEAEWVEIPALKGIRVEQLNNRVMGGLIYSLVKGTKQAKETINTFVNILFDPRMFFMFRYGIEGKTFRQSDGKIMILTDPDTGKPYEACGLTSEMPQFGRFKFPICYEGTREEINASLKVIDIEKSILEDGSARNLLFTVRSSAYDSPMSHEFARKSSEIVKIFETETSMAILGEKSIPEALKDYRLKMRMLGADRILEEANASIGKKPLQKY